MVCQFGLGAVGEIRVKIVYGVNSILFTIVLRKRQCEAHTAISRKVVGKNVQATIPKVIWHMRNILFLTL